MSNILLAVSALVVLFIMITLNYESMSDYSTHVAIKTVKLEDNQSTPHLDLPPLKGILVVPFKNFDWDRKTNTLTVTFGGGKSLVEHFDDIPDFSYTHTFSANQTFAWRCVEHADHTYLGFYKYLGRGIYNNPYLWHYEGQTRYPMQCIYPDLIIDSIDLVDYDHATIFERISENPRYIEDAWRFDRMWNPDHLECPKGTTCSLYSEPGSNTRP